ncbi:MAG: type I secretion system permease/ATPase [Candidatus Nitricoxidivorans perseverans]|uniref:Cyclolysin secretion/processing ATP-binding protein CyaB n=1 Tax=Candidatus Nitricoxidivorans perseverans TaxID=2975601 RepID=A0AA49FNU7_9PROT|nr:MAG: type I secretion system permease/ATPase [Candidatus Nitricoxidivorans perseverans]
MTSDKERGVAADAGVGLREDLLHHDPLLSCLLELTRIHGRPSTATALVAGLPMPESGLTPSLFGRAAARAGFASKVVRRSLDRIDDALLPVVLLLEGNEACLLTGWDEGRGQARLLFPDTGQGSVSLGREELAARYAGIAIFARPHFRFDQRTPSLGEVPQRHWFWGTMLEQWPVYRDVLVAAVLINLFALALPLFTMNVYDRVVPNFAVETLWMLAAGLVLVMGTDYVLRLLRGHFIDLASARIDLKLSAMIMERVLGMRLAQRPASVGSFAATLRSFETVRDFVASATITALIDLPFALLFLLVMAWISWPLVFAPIVGIIAVAIYGYVIQHKMHELSESTFRASALRNATLVESLTALETIKAHGAESRMQAKWEDSAAFLARTSAQLRLLSASAVNGAMTIQQFINVATVVVGVYLIHYGMLSMGGLIACTMLAGRAMAPLGQMVGLLMQFQNARTALTSLEQTMAVPAERANEAGFIHRPELRGEIEFRDVHFTYPGADDEALRGISFHVRSGEHVVVIGRVGSGKTTLQKLILGLHVPDEGAVRIDGVDLRQLDPADLRRNVGYVAQDCLLFYGTLRENITIGAPYADDRAVIAAAEVGGLAEFVDRHPRGYDMLIGERGESLSGGQRQGVAVARAALLDPPVLLLDEATSSMDFTTEAQFKERLRRYAAHKTLLIVTHRLSLLELADRVIVIDDGRILADGPRGKVLDALQSGKVGRAS